MGYRAKFLKPLTLLFIAKKTLKSRYRLPMDVIFIEIFLFGELFEKSVIMEETPLRSVVKIPDSSSLSSPSVGKPEKYAASLT